LNAAAFRLNAELAIRVAVAVIVASVIQTRDEAYDPSNAHNKKWLFFPDWYYLGGLSYCAIMVVFSMGYTVGGTIREVCQGFSGVGLALLYNYVLFAFIPGSYWINIPTLLTTLPWIFAFTAGVMILPFHGNTRKYAVGTNAYFSKY